jgi:hypothetical protein
MDKNWIEGAAKQGERARNRKVFVVKAKWRKSGGCATTTPPVQPVEVKVPVAVPCKVPMP